MILIGNRYNRNIYNAAREAYNLFGNYLPGGSQQYDDSGPDDNSVGENSIKEETYSPKPKSSKKRR